MRSALIGGTSTSKARPTGTSIALALPGSRRAAARRSSSGLRPWPPRWPEPLRASGRNPTITCGIAAPHPADARPRRGGGKQLDSWAERFTQRHQQDPMEHAVRLAIPFALAAVTCVLLAGLWNMVRGGNPNLSQKLMRWRVLLQFIALCIVMTAIYLAGKFPM